MNINVPTCEHSYESEMLPQLDIDFSAYQKTKWQWLSKQWLTIKLSFRLKFKGRWPWTSMRPLIIRQKDSWHSRHYRCCSKQDSWSLCPTTLGRIPSLQRKPWGEQFKGIGGVYLGSKCQRFLLHSHLALISQLQQGRVSWQRAQSGNWFPWYGREEHSFCPYFTQTLGKECLKAAVEKYGCTQKTISLLYAEKLLLWTHKG